MPQYQPGTTRLSLFVPLSLSLSLSLALSLALFFSLSLCLSHFLCMYVFVSNAHDFFSPLAYSTGQLTGTSQSRTNCISSGVTGVHLNQDRGGGTSYHQRENKYTILMHAAMKSSLFN